MSALPPPAWEAPAEPRPRWWHSLKARIVTGALAALFAAIVLTTWHMGRVAEANLLALEQQRSHEEVRRISAVVGHRVAELQRALRLTAEQELRESLNRPEALGESLRDKPVLRSMFAALAVADTSGRLQAVVESTGAKRTAISVADRDYFRRAIETRQPTISAPIASRVNREPVVVFAHPLVDDSGVWGVLSGSLHLNARDLIGDLVETLDNDDSTLLVVTDDDGRILAHPQRGRILQTLADEPRLADVALQWRDDGRPLLRDAGRWTSTSDVVAMAGEPSTGWHVWRVTSRADLLAPLRAARQDAVGVSATFAVLVAALLLVFLIQQLQPLSQVQQRALALLEGDQSGQWPHARGEVGTLVRTLQHVWAERDQIERFNAHVLRRLSSVMAASPVGLAFSRHQRFELVSAECCRLLKCREEDLIGNPMAMIFAAGADYPVLRREARTAFDAGRAYEGEWKLRTTEGHDFWARIRARPVVEGDPESGSIWSLYDIDEQVTARESLRQEALRDPLTGLANRKAFERELESRWERRVSTPGGSVLMIDLDHFKPVNDSGGHAAGDAMLKAVANAVSTNVRGTDLVARLGGDEFAVLLPDCHEEAARAIAEKIRRGIAEIALQWEDRTLRVGASIGVAELQPLHDRAADWLAAADAACYQVKAAGRGGVRGAGQPPVRLVANVV